MAYLAMIVNKGLGIISNRLKGAGTEPKYIGWGTGGATEPTVTDIDLTTPGNESRTSGTSSIVTITTTDDTYQVIGTIICTSSDKNIDEVALFNAAEGGDMLAKANFPPIPVAIDDSITFTIRCKADQA